MIEQKRMRLTLGPRQVGTIGTVIGGEERAFSVRYLPALLYRLDRGGIALIAY